jgi:hypothetical protein
MKERVGNSRVFATESFTTDRERLLQCCFGLNGLVEAAQHIAEVVEGTSELRAFVSKKPAMSRNDIAQEGFGRRVLT